MKIRITLLALAVLAGALVSCGPKTSTSEPAAGNALPKTEGAVARSPAALSSPSLWLLREIAGNPVAAPAEGAKATSSSGPWERPTATPRTARC